MPKTLMVDPPTLTLTEALARINSGVNYFHETEKEAGLSGVECWGPVPVLFTKEVAWEVIETRRMARERPVSPAVWGKYARSISNKTFYPQLHTVKFGPTAYHDGLVKDGVNPIYDGSHRMYGIYNTGIDQIMRVMFNVPAIMHPHIDTPRVRTRYQELGFNGQTDVKLLDTLALRAWHLSQGRRLFRRHMVPTTEEVLALIDIDSGLPEAVNFAKLFTGRKICTPSAAGVAAYTILSESRVIKDEKKLAAEVTRFFGDLVSGARLDEKDPVFMLRERLRTDYQVKAGGASDRNASEQTWLIIRGWNYRQEGKRPERKYQLPSTDKPGTLIPVPQPA